METKSPDLEAHLGYWLRLVSNRVSGTFARVLQAKQISVAEWVVLCRIQQRVGITSGELAEALGLTRGAISKILDKLDVKKLVIRAAKAGDSRAQLLSLTRAGNTLVPQLAKLADQNDRDFFDGLKPAEKVTLRRLLVKLAELHHINDVPVE